MVKLNVFTESGAGDGAMPVCTRYQNEAEARPSQAELARKARGEVSSDGVLGKACAV